MKPFTLLLALAMATSSAVATADTLLIERSQAAQGMNLPSRGQLMSQVEATFGAPTAKQAPVGGGGVHTPPITRWNYPTFTVYFENDHVVSAVLNKAKPNEIGPKPVNSAPVNGTPVK